MFKFAFVCNLKSEMILNWNRDMNMMDWNRDLRTTIANGFSLTHNHKISTKLLHQTTPTISHAHSMLWLDDHFLSNSSKSTPHALPLQLAIQTRLSCPHLLNFLQLKLIFATSFKDSPSPQTSSPRMWTLQDLLHWGLVFTSDNFTQTNYTQDLLPLWPYHLSHVSSPRMWTL